MKKIILTLGIILLLSAVVFAARQVTLDTTVMRSAYVEMKYNALNEAGPDLILVYEIRNTDGSFNAEQAVKIAWDDLPNNMKNNLADFLKYIDQQFRANNIGEANSVLKFRDLGN